MNYLSLFVAWSAFVFIPFNVIAGFIISSSGGIYDIIFGMLLGTILLCALTVPAVLFSVKNQANYAESIDLIFTKKSVKTAFKILVPIVNIGWFTIQTISVASILKIHELDYAVQVIVYAAMAIVFMFGSHFYGYKWLYKFGIIGLASLITLCVFVIFTQEPSLEVNGAFSLQKFTSIISIIIGTWIFSSTTIVMDITKHFKSPKRAMFSILAGTIFANVSLILIGLFYSNTLFFSTFVSGEYTYNVVTVISIFIYVVAIWCTNDSNYYSTKKALNNLGVRSAWTATLNIVTVTCIGVFYGNEFFNIVGNWLKLMGWIGVPMGVLWLYGLIKKP